MYTYRWLSVAAVTVLMLAGCGGSSDSTETATAYYVDSAVAGVSYVCGSQAGTTGKDGAFTFEKGQGCTFSLADIPLRTVAAEELYEAKKIVEDNIDVAQLLQSLDADGNLDNGIQITPQIVEAVKKAVEEIAPENDPAKILKDESAKVELVAKVAEEVKIEAELKPKEKVEEHIEKTLTEVTEALLLDKTFYVVGSYTEDDGIHYELLEIKVTRSGDGLIKNEKRLSGSDEPGTEPIKIEGNKLIFLDDDDGSYTLIEEHGDYIYADDRNADGSKDGVGHWFYTDKAKAEAKYNELTADSEEATDNLEALIVGKTLYQHCKEDNEEWIATLYFKEDGKVEVNDNGSKEVYTYRIEGNKSYTKKEGEDEEELHIAVEITEKYIKIDDNGDGTIDATLYFSAEDARNAPADECGEESNEN